MSVPAIEALRPVPGSIRLVVVRWLLSVLAAAPGVLIGQGSLAESVGTRPWFTEAGDPLPLPQFVKMMGELGALIPVFLVGVVVAWVFLQLLTAAAVEILSGSRGTTGVKVWRTMIDRGGRSFLAYLRIALFSLVLLAIGGRILSLVNGRFEDRAVIEGWTLERTILVQPALFALALLAWAGLVGVWAWWSRVVVARDGRRYVRRVVAMVPRLLWRYPFSDFLIHWVVGLLFVFAGAAVLVAWRQAPGVATGWMILWLMLLAVQAAVWHWRLRVLGLIWSQVRQDDLRSRPDSPWRIFRRLRDRLRRRSAGRTAVAAAGDTALAVAAERAVGEEE